MGLFDDLIPEAPAKQSGSFDDLIPKAQQRPLIAPQELSMGEKIVSALPKGITDWLSNPTIAGENIGAGSRAHGFAMGAADPVVGSVQLLTGGQVSPINQAIDAKNTEYNAARSGQGRDGIDAARIAGNIASPANLAVSAVAPINAVSTLGKIAQGVRAGVLGGSMAPVEHADESYLPEKALQAGAGAVTGGILTPVASKIGNAVTRRFVGLSPAEASQQADKIMVEGINRLQREGVALAPPDVAQLRQQVLQSLQQGKQLDPAAMFRKADFEALGMQPTLGQITRDGAQFSREKNLRGVAGVGDPLLSRLDQQSTRLQELISGKSAGAADDFSAGQQMMQSLKGVDDGMNAKVGAAYDMVKDHVGRAAPMDSHAFSEQANLAINENLLNDALPAQARNILNKVTTGEIPFNVNTSMMIDKRFSGLQRDLMASGNKEGALAVGKLRSALNDSPIADNVGEDAKGLYDVARGMARDRFKTHEAIPALKAAVDGDVSAQDFVRRFLINGKVEDVSGLAKVMPEEARQEARKQFSAAIERAAFGQNMTGDKGIAQESLAKFLNQSGMKQKMGAFFSPDEMAQFDRISRVAAYTTSFPANNTVNTSNTASAALNLLSKVPGVPSSIGLINSAKNAAGNYTAVNSALEANPAQAAADISPKQLELLSRILGGGMGGIAGAAGTGIGH